jgi:hypothetical protein
MTDEQTVSVIEELRALERMARAARERLAAGQAVNGTSALYRIETRANDVARWVEGLRHVDHLRVAGGAR